MVSSLSRGVEAGTKGDRDRFKGKDFVFLAISREESKEQVKKFRERNGYTFPDGT